MTHDRILAEGGAVEVTAAGEWRHHLRPTAQGLALLPGAFNPVHEGHRQLAETARDLLGAPVALELSLANVDKPDLSWPEVRRRLTLLSFRIPVWITRAATFVKKAELFPETVFVVGADTAARIVALRYYGHDSKEMTRALEFIASRRCRFLVAGRCDASQRFMRLDELPIPAKFRGLFSEISPELFRVDISSTELRTR